MRRRATPRSGSRWTTPPGRASPSVARAELAGSADLALPLPVVLASREAGEYIGVHRRRRAPGPPGLGRASRDVLVPSHRRQAGSGRDHSRRHATGERSMSRMRHPNRRSRALLTAALVALPPVVPSALGADTAAPIARKKPTVRELHGDKFVDDYFWLREKSTPEVKAYLEAENVYTDAVMKPLQGAAGHALQGDARPHQGDRPLGPGARRRLLLLHADRAGASSTRSTAARRAASTPPKRCISTSTSSPRARSSWRSATMSVSDDGNLLAYTTDTTGFREYKLYVRTCAPASCWSSRPRR